MKKYLILLLWLHTSAMAWAKNDTIRFDTTPKTPQIEWKHRYHQTLVMKLFLSQALFDGKYKRKDNGKSEVFCTIPEALEVIKKIDHLTVGIPKIIYLVGWQYNGHDSKYPAWFEGNERLKRPEDPNALESIRWLMRSAKKYNTTVSLHINMFDAYEDSPLWNEYVNHNIIARNKDGTLKAGEWGYPISYAQEWKMGYTKKRIDSLCALLPVEEAGTIHIDAFHTWAPIGKKGPGIPPFIKEPVSQFLDFTIADETAAQEKIFRYWASKGIDVTSESAMFLRETAFEGLQPMAWWVNWGLEGYLKWPAYYYTGGVDRSEWGRLFGTSMHGEDIIRNDRENLSGFMKAFCLNTVIWYFLNSLDRQYVATDKKIKTVGYSGGVITRLREDGQFHLFQNGKILVRNGDMILPAKWLKTPALIAYSEKGFKNKVWRLPAGFDHIRSFDVVRIALHGKMFLGQIKNKYGHVTLTLWPDQAVLLIPVKENEK